MKKIITAAFVFALSLSAFPSEKGGNGDGRGHELLLTLDFFQSTNMCHGPTESKYSKVEVCKELENEIQNGIGDQIGEEYFNQCCVI